MQAFRSSLYRLSPLLLLIFIDSFSFFVVIPVLLKIFYQPQYGLLSPHISGHVRDILTGLAISLSMLAALIAAPFVGNLSDRYGRKKTLLMCIVSVAIGFVLPIIGIIFKNIYLIFVGRFMSGVGSASQPVAQAAVADIGDEKSKPLFLSFIALMMTLALIVGPLSGSYLSDAHLFAGFHIITPFVFAFGLSVCNLLLIFFFLKETQGSGGVSGIVSFQQVVLGLPGLVKRYRLGFLLILFVSLELSWSQYYQSIPLYLKRSLHFTTDHIGLFSALMGVMMALGLMFVYPLLLRIMSIKKILFVSIVLISLGFVIFSLSSSAHVQWIFSGLVALCVGCAYVCLVTLISNKASLYDQGVVMGYLSTLLYFSWMITSAISGVLFSINKAMPFYIALLFIVTPFLFLIFQNANLKHLGLSR